MVRTMAKILVVDITFQPNISTQHIAPILAANRVRIQDADFGAQKELHTSASINFYYTAQIQPKKMQVIIRMTFIRASIAPRYLQPFEVSHLAA